jgi:hypothetical protein
MAWRRGVVRLRRCECAAEKSEIALTWGMCVRAVEGWAYGGLLEWAVWDANCLADLVFFIYFRLFGYQILYLCL